MAKQYRKELSFQAGEITPRFLGRSDSDVYDKGLSVAENVVISKHGGAYKRQGLEHIGRIVGDTARVFTIQISRQRYYTIIIHRHPTPTAQFPTEMIILGAGARLLGNNLLLNGNFADAQTNWNSTVNPASSRVQFTIGEATLIPEQNNNELTTDGGFIQATNFWIERTVGGGSSVSSDIGEVILVAGDGAGRFAGIAQEMNTTSLNEVHSIKVTGNYTNEIKIQVGVNQGDTDFLDVDVSLTGEFFFTPNVSPFFVTVDCINPNTTAIINEISVTEFIEKSSAISQQATVVAAQTDEHVVIVGQRNPDILHVHIGTTEGANDILDFISSDIEIVATFIPNAPDFWVTVFADGDETVTASVTFVGTAAEVPVPPLGILMDAPWTEDQLREVHVIETPEGRKQYFTHPNVQVQALSYSFANDIFVNLTSVVFLAPPTQWTGTNWPSTGTYFQGRLWLGGTPNQRETIWASVSGSPEDFTEGTSHNVSPAASFSIVLAEYGRIEWMLGTKNLLIGSENGEHIITSEGSFLSNSDSSIEQQSSFGSSNMQSIQVGEKVFYLTPDGRKLRAMSYQWEEDNWLSQDLTFISEHITLGIGVHRSWAQHPENLFILTLEDGTVALMTYDRTAQTIAWSHITIPEMTIFDTATGRDNGVNEIVLVGQRVAGFVDVETNSGGKQYLDSYVSVFDPLGTNLITGLDHLEGKTVTALVDGAIEPPKIVIGGQITTQRTGEQLYAGISYNAKIVTLPLDSPKSDQQIRSFKKNWGKIWALMLDSKQPIINGIRPPERTPSTLMDTVEPSVTGHFKSVNLGIDDFGVITIEQDLPVPMFVLAIYGEFTAETL